MESNHTPIIGILCQPISSGRKREFKLPQYILNANVNFVELAGGRPMRIPIDLDEEKLIKLLDQCNGALFTGGFTDLILKNGDQTPYYQTAKTIYNYCLRK